MKRERRRLLDWYRRKARELPWRQTRDPYRILVSEVMLQQTRVETVLPYYERFVERFPSLEQLARASEEEVLAAWSGLGYYRRARFLHDAARQILASGGRLPESAGELQSLPGVGAYTAAAVASIAFGEAVPAIDGNLERVLARLLALDTDPRRQPGRGAVHSLASELLDPAHAGESNQALMELGATVCRPLRPDCPRCPLGRICRGKAGGEPERYPQRPAKRPTVIVRRLVAVAEEEGRVLLVRRPPDSAILAGFWELPSVELGDGDETALGERYGGRWWLAPGSRLVRHSITYRRLELQVRRARFRAGGPLATAVAEAPEAGWFSVEETASLPLSSLVGKCLSAAAELERRPVTSASRRATRRRRGCTNR